MRTGPISPEVEVVDLARSLRNGHEKSASPPQGVNPRIAEKLEIEALRTAQKHRTPVAVALSADYEGAPFKVPRNFIVLGWFWVIDAWASRRYYSRRYS
jgi:hypothetical protein